MKVDPDFSLSPSPTVCCSSLCAAAPPPPPLLAPSLNHQGLSADMLATDLAEYLVRKGVPFR